MKKPLLFTFALFVFCQLGFSQDTPDVWYVAPEELDGTGGDNDNSGQSLEEAWATIQFAIGNSNVNNGDTIKVTPGVYFGSINVTKSIVIQGIGEGTVTISEQIQVSNPNVLLQNLSISSSLIIAGNNASVLNSVINSTLTINSGVTGFTLNENNLANNTATIDNESGEVIDATYNWWGSQEKAAVTGGFDQDVNYSPWLNSGDDIAENEAGFQPNLSSVSVDGSGDDDLQNAAESLGPGAAITLLSSDVPYSSLEVNSLLTIVTLEGESPQIQALSTSGASFNDTLLVVDGNITVASSITLRGGSMFTIEGSQVTLNSGATLLEQEGFLIGDIVQITIDDGSTSINSLGVRISAGSSPLGEVSINRITGEQGIVQANDTTSVATKWIINAQNDPLPEGQGRIITLFWFGDFNNGQNISTAVMWRQLDGSDTWEPVGSEPNPSSGTSNVFSVSTTEPVTQFSTWTISSDAAPLPVTLVDFTARLDESSVRLDWATASETNASFFAIERSTDGLFFDEVSRSQAAGESNRLRNYLYIDEGIANRLTGTLYYRLRMVDFDESFEYSNIVAISLTGDNDLRVYADASAGTLKLFTQQLPAGTYLVQVSDMLGNILIESNLSTTDENPVFSFPLSSPARSVYVVRCFGAQALYTQKFRLE